MEKKENNKRPKYSACFYVFALSGVKGSGKDTVADMIVDYEEKTFERDFNYRPLILRAASALKKMAQVLAIGLRDGKVDNADLNDPEVKNRKLINGLSVRETMIELGEAIEESPAGMTNVENLDNMSPLGLGTFETILVRNLYLYLKEGFIARRIAIIPDLRTYILYTTLKNIVIPRAKDNNPLDNPIELIPIYVKNDQKENEVLAEGDNRRLHWTEDFVFNNKGLIDGDFYTIENNGSLDDLRVKVYNFMDSLNK